LVAELKTEPEEEIDKIDKIDQETKVAEMSQNPTSIPEFQEIQKNLLEPLMKFWSVPEPTLISISKKLYFYSDRKLKNYCSQS